MDSHGISQPGSSFCNPRTRRATWCALDAEGCLGLLVTGLGRFRARLTHVTLHGLRIAATEEQLARTSLVAIPADMLLVSLPQTNGSAAIWGGIRIGAGEFMTLGPGQRAHTRTDRSCRWASIWLPAAELVCYGSAFAVPSAVLAGRPRPAMGRHLRHLHAAAIRLVERGSNTLIDEEAAHGLEQ